MAGFTWRVRILCVSIARFAVVAVGCSGSEGAKQCVGSDGSQVCAWRDGPVRISTTGLEPGSSVDVAMVGGGDPIESGSDLKVGEDGTLPGVLSIISATGGEVTLEITAVAAGRALIAGRVVVG